MEIVEKKPMPAWIYVWSLALNASLWAHPITDGAARNLTSFVLWAIGMVILLTSIAAVFMDDKPRKFKRPNRLANWVSRIAFWGGMAWMVGFGYFALPAILLVSCALMFIVQQRAKEAGIE